MNNRSDANVTRQVAAAVFMATALGAISALAMPTKQELAKAQPLVAELMADDVAAFKAKTKKAEEIGDLSVKYAQEASTEAAKFILLKGAVSYYVRAEQYDKAADAIQTLRTEIANVPPATVEEIIRKNTARVTPKKAPRLFAQYQTAKVQMAAAKEVAAAKASLEKTPKDVALLRKLAEAQALSGDWKAALATFAQLGGKAGSTAKAEVEGKGLPEVADFWWEYESYLGENDGDAFKSHAAAIYKKCLDDGTIDGLKKNIVEKRLKQVEVAADTPATKETAIRDAAPNQTTANANGKDIILDIVGADSIRLIYCPPGTCEVGFDKDASPFVKHRVSITRPFWMSEAPITVGQYCALMGPFEARFSPRWMPPADLRKFTEAMGGDKGAVSGLLPAEIDAYCQKIAERNGGVMPKGYIPRLPTDAEWFYALSCGGKVKEPNYAAISRGAPAKSLQTIGVDVLKTVDRVMHECNVAFDQGSPDWKKQGMTPRYRVKTCKPNDWGFYDMVGLCWELLADTMTLAAGRNATSDEGQAIFLQQYLSHLNGATTDPIMIAGNSDARAILVYGKISDNGIEWVKRGCKVGKRSWGDGFRLVIGPDLVSEWKAKHGKK